MDKVFLSSISLSAAHGVLEEEKSVPQRFEIDLALFGDLSTAAGNDDLNDTYDYSRLGEIAVAVATERQFNLIEALAGEIATRLLQATKADEVEVTVRKMDPPVGFALSHAGCTIRRRRG